METISQTLSVLSTIVGLSAYIPSIVLIIQGKIKPSFCTWSLWTLLNIIVLISLIQHGAPYAIAVAYTIGTSVISLLVLFKRQFSWNSADMLILLLVLVSGFVLYFSTSSLAIIIGSLASFIAGIPEMRKALRNPKNVSRLTAILFITANTLVIIATKELTIVNIIYSLSWISYWTITLGISFRKIK